MKHNKTPLMKCIGLPLARLVLLVACCIASVIPSRAQEIWGISAGTEYTSSFIFNMNVNGSEYRKATFPGGGNNNTPYFDGESRHFRLVKASNGKFYGITLGRDGYGAGIFFEFDSATGLTREIVTFEYYDVLGEPIGFITEYNGKIYGTSNSLRSLIFSYDLATDVVQSEVLLPSSCRDLTMVNGKFYGMTRRGGTKWAGAVFEFNPQTSKYQVLSQFDNDLTGRFPDGGLTHINGKLYGLTSSGGKFSNGTLIEYDIATQQFQKKIDFKSSINGSFPTGNLILYNGKLIGVTSSGGVYNKGTVFEYDPSTSVLTKIMDFSSDSQGKYFDNIHGTLYGLTTNGGSEDEGTLFTFDPASGVYTYLYEFNTGGNGAHPFGHIVIDGNKILGMTHQGGSPSNSGVIFEYDLVTHQYAKRTSFNYFPYGKGPTCLVDVNDKIYGLTWSGGETGGGTLYEFDPVSFSFSTLHNFDCTLCGPFDYYYYELDPAGSLLSVGNKLYGTTWKNGQKQEGEFFEYNMDTHVFKSIHEFDVASSGIAPTEALAELNGKIYGTTSEGGTNNTGVLFEYDIATSQFTVKLNLNTATTGVQLKLSRINNSIYGISKGGPNGRGMLSQYVPGSNTLEARHYFTNGAERISYPEQMTSIGKKLYGFLSHQNENLASVFEFDTQAQELKVLHDFSYDNYSTPGRAALTSVNSKLYGIHGYSSIFELVPETNAYQLTTSIGYGPITDIIVKGEEEDDCSPLSVISEIISYDPGKRQDNRPIALDRNNPQFGLIADNYDSRYSGEFVALGFGGSIVLKFDQPFCNSEGADFHIYETSYDNNPFYDYPEQAEVFVSQDGNAWTSMGRTATNNPAADCISKLDADVDIQLSGLDWIQYVKLVDVTNPWAKRRDPNTCIETGSIAFNNAADGFDLDGISGIRNPRPPVNGRRAAQVTASSETEVDAAHSKAVVYPNPTSATLIIDLSEEEELAFGDGKVVFDIVDIQGRVLERSVDVMDENWLIKQDVSKLRNGLYIARVKNGNTRRHYKFMKN